MSEERREEPIPESGQPPSPEEVDRQVTEAVETLGEQWQWMRERLGEDQWRRLSRLRGLWVVAYKVNRVAITYAGILVCILAFAMLMDGIARKPSKYTASMLLVFALPLSVAGLAWIGMQMVRGLLSRELSRLGLHGHSPEAVQQALWTEFQARALEAERPAILLTARRQEEWTSTPPWWRVELSGIHAVLWATVPLAIAALALPQPPDWLAGVVLAAVVYWTFKIALLLLWAVSRFRHDAWAGRAYRWCRTTDGAVIALIAVPVLVIAAIAVAMCVSWALGGWPGHG